MFFRLLTLLIQLLFLLFGPRRRDIRCERDSDKFKSIASQHIEQLASIDGDCGSWNSLIETWVVGISVVGGSGLVVLPPPTPWYNRMMWIIPRSGIEDDILCLPCWHHNFLPLKRRWIAQANSSVASQYLMVSSVDT